MTVLTQYKSVFATSLEQVGMLNTNPYEIQIKEDAVHVKVVAHRMIPHDSQEWFKDYYLAQLLELGLIEPCSGLWAAGVVLFPTDAKRRVPRQRKATPMRKASRLKLNKQTNAV
ncbi:hypothetical protein [Parasitella parasitica]|uniref:Uncharacterized protein n=1 Tax=Parasitella parasitica TaxID=35722 RepID=A0A0B7NA77_9FUNG|nr:hypothetical protein [Parasitella parasitica]